MWLPFSLNWSWFLPSWKINRSVYFKPPAKDLDHRASKVSILPFCHPFAWAMLLQELGCTFLEAFIAFLMPVGECGCLGFGDLIVGSPEEASFCFAFFCFAFFCFVFFLSFFSLTYNFSSPLLSCLIHSLTQPITNFPITLFLFLFHFFHMIRND